MCTSLFPRPLLNIGMEWACYVRQYRSRLAKRDTCMSIRLPVAHYRGPVALSEAAVSAPEAQGRGLDWPYSPHSLRPVACAKDAPDPPPTQSVTTDHPSTPVGARSKAVERRPTNSLRLRRHATHELASECVLPFIALQKFLVSSNREDRRVPIWPKTA